ncbi:dehydrogenase/reductase SDR family member 7 [Episyrphus balteatus]|uniref:dehydrogenase/reductase SDR family member 7 n=1 Tax=Episyrphus balteatus TaxID=286459 RepID=UPI002486591D|nr:dehydrogenase/reductase SDR family member 7 [Episyrphus balteatus]
MNIFELVGLIVILYFLANIILWIVLDADIQLSFKERFGQPISSLRGQVVWITGASSGIGKYLAIVLAKNGVKVALSARRENELKLVQQQCLAASNGLLSDNDVLVLPIDMLDFKSHDKCLKIVLEHFGSLDILVNNAGRSQRASWESIDIEVDREMFELNVFSVINLSRLVLRYFMEAKKGQGHLAVTSSGAGITAVPFSGSYLGAKHALHGYFKGLVVEVPSIDVTLFCPGPIATNFLEEAFTGNPNEKVGQSTAGDKRRMTAERCAELFAVALSNKVKLAWVGLFPVNILLYLSQYYPNVTMLIYKLLGPDRLKKIREGKSN